jgi:hypothetical protein
LRYKENHSRNKSVNQQLSQVGNVIVLKSMKHPGGKIDRANEQNSTNSEKLGQVETEFSVEFKCQMLDKHESDESKQ